MKRSTRRTMQQVDLPLSSGAPPRLALSAGQIQAIFGAMRTFRDDDLARPVAGQMIVCARCSRNRSAAGSLAYGAVRLCNGCATDYELLRMAGLEHDLLHPAS